MTASQKDSHKQWWTPVWTGLVMDPDGRHYCRIRNALWLFLYLLLNANRKTGFLVRKVHTISKDTGINQKTILRWLIVLRKQGYIATKSNGRCLQIQIKKWKGADMTKTRTQMSQISDIRCLKNVTSKSSSKSQFPVHFGSNNRNSASPNDITINKYKLKNDIDRGIPHYNRRAPKGSDKKQLLALELADALDDKKSLALYIAYSRRYPEKLLRKALIEAKDMPSTKIKKSRAALFNHLVQKYARTIPQDFSC